MARSDFSLDEWKLLVNAPHWVYAALVAADRGAISTRRTEAKALEVFLSGYKTESPLVKEIIAGQKEADDKLEGSLEDAERMLGQVDTLLERKANEAEGDAVRDLLMKAGAAVADATREAVFGDRKSATEEKTLARIQTALKATDEDKRRRQQAAAAEVERRAQQARELQARAVAERQRVEAAQAEAQKKAAEAEAKKKAQEAEARRLAAEAEAKERAEELEAAKKAREAEVQRRAAEAEAQRKAAEAEAQKKAAEAEAQKQAAAAAAASAGAARIYVVKPGDTLSGIALQMYGKAGRWREIYEANRDIIKKPNLIRPGWKLRIPD